MSNLPNQNAVHNDDNDDQQQQSTNKIPSFNSRITSRSIIKRQQFTETRIANNQACDEIHDLQPKYSANKKTNSHELMQGNYYDRTRLSNDSPIKQANEQGQLAISVDDYRDRKKKPTPICSNENQDRSISPPFGETSESIQENVGQSAGKLLETKKHSTKTTTKSHKQAALNYFPNNDDNQQQSSSSPTSSSSDCSTDDDSSKHKSDVPYVPLINDDEEEQTIEQPKKSPIDSSNQLAKTSSQLSLPPTSSQSTSTTNDRVKYFPTNGYNSHGSSITTKSSSDNSGSIRTNSGSDNDEESDEEPYNNSSVTNNTNTNLSYPSMNRNIQQPNSYSYRNRNFNNQTSESAQKNDEQHLQINRIKQTSADDSNKQQPINSSSSQSATNSRLTRSSKKRKQAQQQEIIRTELIPGHRGDLDVDELVMFIDGDSVPLPSTDTNKSRVTTDSTANKTSMKKKARKTSKSASSSTVIDDHENDLNETKEEVNLTTESQTKQPEKVKESIQPVKEIVQTQIDPSSTTLNNSNNETVSDPFVMVSHRRRIGKERRPEPNPVSRPTRYPPSVNNNEKRRVTQRSSNESSRSTVSNTSSSSTIKEETPTSNSSAAPAPVPKPARISVPIANTTVDQPTEKVENSPRLSSHSSSSSLSSLLKRQSKPAPPVVFLNKSVDIDLNDVSFGFDLDTNPLEQPVDDKQTTESKPSEENPTEKSVQKLPQRTNRTPQFYSGQDIRPQQQTTYIDPLALYQYNQRLANYSQQLAYINLLRPPYMTPQSQYILLPTAYPTVANEAVIDSETNQTLNEPVQEPVLVYTPQTGPVYVQTTKKPYSPPEYPQQTSISTTVYPTQIYYPNQLPHMMSSHSAYFQPINASSLLIESKSEQGDVEPDDENENSTKTYSQSHQPTSADIMSNALQLVYSQQRRTAQTDRFNLDDLTAYLAMKWTDTVDHYLQGDSRILYVGEQ